MKQQLQEGQRFNPHALFHGVYIPDPVFYYAGLKPMAKLCYGRLLRYNGKDNKCHPKVDTLAAELHLSARQVQKYLNQLSVQGFIRRVAPEQQERRRLPNNIEFLAHKVFVEAPEKHWRGELRFTPIRETEVNVSSPQRVSYGSPARGSGEEKAQRAKLAS